MVSHTALLTQDQLGKLKQILKQNHFEFVAKEHTIYAAKKDNLRVHVYRKGPKVLVQGKQTKEFVDSILSPLLGTTFSLKPEPGLLDDDPSGTTQPHFGIDESGKGDFFGPLVIAGVYTDHTIAQHLLQAGVMDSKRITSPGKIRKLATLIKNTPAIEFDVIALRPSKYNEIYPTFKNLNHLLAWGHSTVIEELIRKKPTCPRALSDQFARASVLQNALHQKNITIELEQKTKGESDIAVAAASILARERFINWMDVASEKLGMEIPLGASPKVVSTARRLAKLHGPEILKKLTKTHFKTTAQVVS